MEFDITHLDRKILIRALFAYSSPVGIGIAEYQTRKLRNENVDGLSDSECVEILFKFEQMESGYKRVLDYHKGKPMKLDFVKNLNGQIKVGTSAYDARNGKYRFLEAMLDTFLEEEIIITKKGYGEFVFSVQPEHLNRPKPDLQMFKNILKNCIPNKSENGRFWKIDSTKKEYRSPVLRLFNE